MLTGRFVRWMSALASDHSVVQFRRVSARAKVLTLLVASYASLIGGAALRDGACGQRVDRQHPIYSTTTTRDTLTGKAITHNSTGYHATPTVDETESGIGLVLMLTSLGEVALAGGMILRRARRSTHQPPSL